ncbi:hypothetical protein J3R08_001875 [Micromonospora sp. HB375]|nr:hypothetical protein [Micromonospora sp. HB375]
MQDLSQPLPADPNSAGGMAVEVVGELPHSPAGERPPQCFRAGAGRLDDERFVIVADQAGTATRPLRVQADHAHLVEPVNDLPNRVLIRLHQPGDRRRGVPTG